nr:hypothetical protein OG296_41030 [Streptomyces sp. NBC_01001]
MSTPGAVFRPSASDLEQVREVIVPPLEAEPPTIDFLPPRLPAQLPSPRVPVDENQVRAVEFTCVISQADRLCLPGNQKAEFGPALGGHTTTI